jgi:hypothetical protein
MLIDVIVHICSISSSYGNLAVFCLATYATHVNNDVSKHILFDWFDNILAVFCIATYATHVNNASSQIY